MKIAILTVSDRCYKKEAEDRSGPLLKQLLSQDFENAHFLHTCVPDDIKEIQEKIKYWVDEQNVDLLLTSGGTGLSPRDVTPEAMEEILDMRCPGVEHLIQSEALNITALAMLSRPTCGIRKRCLVITLPGSAKAVKENYAAIKTLLPHAVKRLQSMKH